MRRNSFTPIEKLSIFERLATILDEKFYVQEKEAFSKQIEAEGNPVVKARAQEVLNTVDRLAEAERNKEKPGYGDLTESLQEATKSLKAPERIQAGIGLRSYANKMQGKPSWK